MFIILSFDHVISSATQTDEYRVVYGKLENVPVAIEGLTCPPTAILVLVICTVPKPPRTFNSLLRVLRAGTRPPTEQECHLVRSIDGAGATQRTSILGETQLQLRSDANDGGSLGHATITNTQPLRGVSAIEILQKV